MPRWKATALTYKAFCRRFGIPRDDLREILDGILPVAVVDNAWHSRDLDVFGVYGQTAANGLPQRYMAGNLVAPDDRDVFVWKISAVFMRNIALLGPSGDTMPIHLFTPLQNYVPTTLGPAISLPWLQTGLRTGQPGHLGGTVLLTGSNTLLQSVLVNGVPHTCIGPLLRMPGVIQPGFQAGAGQNFSAAEFCVGPHAPPIRVKAGGQLCVQTANLSVGIVGDIETLDVSFWYSERPAGGDVG